MCVASIADREIALTRTFNAPRELVFRAWTEPQHLMKWLCPKDFVVTFVDVDLRVGGVWRSGMRSPEGIDYVMRGTYRELVPPDRLVFTHSWEDDKEAGHEPGLETLISITLSEFDGITTMTFHVDGLTSDESRDGQKQGWSEAFDNLNRSLQDLQ
ncbi:MAG: SRPBCC domain-containing protein [Chlorobia bacterium]|nr:SRPBCC domain-containing protein [Fimbriimonadaceae bacterium]